MSIGSGWSKTWTYFLGDWHEGNVPIMGPRTHAAWLCSVVFDGARAFEGVTPDLLFEIGRPDLDWVHLAKGMGVPGTRVHSLEGFAKALRQGFESDGPSLIEVPL